MPVVCLLSGKCSVCNVMVKRPVLFLAVYTLQGSRNVGQFIQARHREFLPDSMQHSNCCLKREDPCPGQEVLYNTSVSKCSPNMYALKHKRPSVIDFFCLGLC